MYISLLSKLYFLAAIKIKNIIIFMNKYLLSDFLRLLVIKKCTCFKHSDLVLRYYNILNFEEKISHLKFDSVICLFLIISL